ncbi:hypothetical protein Cgig2_010473 [Carnegiea gigantea]|uniref:Uncharacterized protein n=1 Tax=Carnegiea gigantea TaxID=171969 RepID=A0A9Q1Q9T6_9CARY|nr:hypothetical protein Cgig2_010473 [Carnegiea gigantea]
MLKFRRLSFHGLAGEQALSFSLLHGFRHLLLYSTSSSSLQSLADQLVHSLSFSRQQAFSISDKLVQTRRFSGPNKVSDPNVLRKADSVIGFLKQNGLDQSHIRDMVSSLPKILMCKVDKTLKPKFEVLQEHGFSGPDLAVVVSADPSILLCGLNSTILPVLRALGELLSTDDAVAIMKTMKGLKRSSFRTVANFLLPNIALFQNYGIPMELIRKHLLARPSAFVRSTKSLETILIRVEGKLGIPRNSRMFFYGVYLLSSNCERNIESKCQVFKSFGWSQSDIRELMRRGPNCFRLSEENIKKSLNYLMKELGCEPKFVISNVFLLTCSLESRLVPRYRILMVLKEKGLVRQNYAFPSAVKLSESQFLMKFVLPFEEVHQFYAKQTGVPVGAASSKLDEGVTQM